jgi:ribosomal silencing factor RsfS
MVFVILLHIFNTQRRQKYLEKILKHLENKCQY